MRLIIDCFKLVKGAGKSIGIYNLAKSLTIHLGEMALGRMTESAGEAEGKNKPAIEGTKPQADEILVFGNSVNRADFDVPGVTFIEIPKDPSNMIVCVLWELFDVVRYGRKYHADRLLFPRGFRPLCTGFGKKKIPDTIIIHDLIPFFYHENYPGYFNRLENAYIMNRLLASMRHSDRIITISECSRQDIMKRVPSAETRTTVIYNGFNDVNYDKNEGINNNSCYIVAMTSSLPHKNPAGILTAYEEYYHKAANPLDLYVIGIGDSSHKTELEEEVKKHIHFYRFMKDFGEMCRLIAGGRAYLFLSYAEGFGFPPLEAMQLGLPVVCSDRSSLPEVVRDAGILLDPDDYAGIAAALISVTEDEGKREELIQKGYENVKRFSWDSRTRLYWEELFR